jgi:hypothetical protein
MPVGVDTRFFKPLLFSSQEIYTGDVEFTITNQIKVRKSPRAEMGKLSNGELLFNKL